LNGHVGTDRLQGYERWHGGRLAGRRNDDGEKILKYMQEVRIWSLLIPSSPKLMRRSIHT